MKVKGRVITLYQDLGALATPSIKDVMLILLHVNVLGSRINNKYYLLLARVTFNIELHFHIIARFRFIN